MPCDNWGLNRDSYCDSRSTEHQRYQEDKGNCQDIVGTYSVL